MLKPSKPLSIGLALAGMTIFFITSMMIRSAGISSGTSGGGQDLLGYGNIAIHITGLVLFGIATGYLFRAKLRIFGVLTGIVVVGTALFSMKNLTDFVAAERMSVAKAREEQSVAQRERQKAVFEAAKKRQDLQAKLAETQLKWIQGTEKRADGRNERRDSMEQGTKLITEFGKSEVAIPDAIKTETILRPDSGTELISKATGLDKDSIELFTTLYGTLLLIVMESIIWPLAAFFYPPKGYREATQGVLEPVSPPRSLAPTAREQRLLTAPRPKEKPPTIKVEPDAGWRALLDEVDYPPAGSIVQGTQRPKDKREHVAPRFLTWLHAHGLAGDITTDNLTVLYERFNSIDHRTPWGERIVKNELEGLGKKFATKNTRNSPAVYTIPVQTPEKVRLLLEKKGVLEPRGGGGSPSSQDLEPDEPAQIEGDAPSGSKVFALFGRPRTGLH